MGYESDYVINSAIGHEEEIVAAIGPSLEECSTLNIITKGDALRYLSTKVCLLKTKFYIFFLLLD